MIIIMMIVVIIMIVIIIIANQLAKLEVWVSEVCALVEAATPPPAPPSASRPLGPDEALQELRCWPARLLEPARLPELRRRAGPPPGPADAAAADADASATAGSHSGAASTAVTNAPRLSPAELAVALAAANEFDPPSRPPPKKMLPKLQPVAAASRKRLQPGLAEEEEEEAAATLQSETEAAERRAAARWQPLGGEGRG